MNATRIGRVVATIALVDVGALDTECDTYIVFDDFGRLGAAWREMTEEQTDRETLLRDLLAGQFSDPVRIVAFNTERRWSEDVSAEIAAELIQRCEGCGFR